MTIIIKLKDMILYIYNSCMLVMVIFLPNVVEDLVLVMLLARVEVFMLMKESAANLVSKALLQLTTAHKVLHNMV